MYALGIDLGTTYTAAAVWRDGRAEIVSLGDRTAAIPSVVLLRQDETFLTGEAANRRGLTEPNRVAREFKRRVGDTTPIMLGGTPHSAESLMSRLLRAAVDEVVKREGGPPARVCVSHPANWGPYKIDLLGQAVRMADLPSVLFTTEPEAAATHYAQEQRLGVGAVVAVYDLGGGTFDAAVLRRTATGFTILGKPEGIERLGGIDFDAAVFNHVRTALGGKLDDLDEDDPAAIAAVARLREECVQAKEALSADTDTTIPVLLPSVTTDVRLTRGEFESMVRPALHGSIEALRRAVRSAGCTPEQLHSVLLVGGSSRMPIVGQLVSAELGRPVAVDTHPKHAVALGAAWRAGLAWRGAPAGRGGPVTDGGATAAGPGGPPRGAGLAAAGAGFAAGRASVPGTSSAPGRGGPANTSAAVGGPAPRGAAGARPGGAAASGPPTNVSGTRDTGRPNLAARGAERPSEPVSPPSAPEPDRRKRLMALGVAGAVVALLAGGGVGLALINGDDGGAGAAANPPSSTVPTTANSLLPPDEQCTDAIMSNPSWVCLTAAVVADGKLTIQYVSDGGALSVGGGKHLHIYGSDGTNPPDRIMGHQVPESEQGEWYVEDRRPSVVDVTSQKYVTAVGDAPKVCARIATADHVLVKATDGSYRTGNCVPVTRAEVTPTEAPPQTPRPNRPPQTHHETTTTETTSSSTEPSTTEPPPDSEPATPPSEPENAEG
ncbi:Hsp70 family protein [Actinophytocola sp. NPDC049390]|uniref:Hsp70 family protein n=1 Tax=Actinophytocola sp. NPDC049390 TaxID=3363894 RepID=UPI003791ACF0